MRLVAPADQGKWFLYSEDEKTRERVEFKVRRIPAGFIRQIETEHLGRKRQSKYRKGFHVLEYDADVSETLLHLKAAYALVDSRNAELPAADVPAIRGEVDAEGFVQLDGQWTAEVKAQAFQAFPDLAIWVLATAERLEVKGREEEEGKGATS